MRSSFIHYGLILAVVSVHALGDVDRASPVPGCELSIYVEVVDPAGAVDTNLVAKKKPQIKRGVPFKVRLVFANNGASDCRVFEISCNWEGNWTFLPIGVDLVNRDAPPCLVNTPVKLVVAPKTMSFREASMVADWTLPTGDLAIHGNFSSRGTPHPHPYAMGSVYELLPTVVNLTD